jgi:hypothetical protein
MGPVFLAIAVLVGGALVVAVMQNKDKEKKAAAAAEQPAETPQTSNPFADRDNDPKARDGSKIGTKNTAPEGLEETPLWVDAKAKAEKGMALVKEAIAARNKGDEETYRSKGLEGYNLLDEALLNTGDWLVALLAQHPGDRQVSRIERHRSRWGDSYKKVRKIE